MWLDKFFLHQKRIFFSASACGREWFIGAEHIDSPRCQRVESFLSQGLPGFTQLPEPFGGTTATTRRRLWR
jgi:hypothetical protein